MKRTRLRNISVVLAAVIVVCMLSPMALAAENPTVTVDWDQEFQEIDGFGFTQEEEFRPQKV